MAAKRAALCILCLLTVSHAAKIIFMPMFGDSHYYVLKKIGEEMAARGHEVILLIPSCQKHKPTKEFTHITYPFLTEHGEIEHVLQKMAKEKKSILVRLNPIARPLEIQLIVCGNLIKEQEVMKRLKTFHADLLVADFVYMCSGILQDALDIPRVDVSPTGLMPIFVTRFHAANPLSYIPQSFTGFPEKMSFVQRVRNVAGYIVSTALNKFTMDYSFDNLKKELAVRPERSFQETRTDAEMLLVQADFALDIPRPLPPAIKMVGPVLPAPAKPLPADLEQFMQTSGDAGVILVSFGSMLSRVETSILKKMMAAFGRLKCKVLWKVKRSALPSPISPNIKTMDWLPQNDILGHNKTRAFVSHMGHNGLYESAYHGVPIVGCPQFGDQTDNAALMGRAGMGLWINLESATDHEFYNIINRVLSEPQFQTNASRVSLLIRDRQRKPVKESADWIEFVLRQGGRTRHLRVRAFDIPWYQLYLLDVIAFLVAIVTVVIMLMASILRCLCKVCCSKKSTKGKTE